MPNFLPISLDRHASQRWLRPPHYFFAGHDAVCFLTAHELPAAALHLPIAFLAIDGAFMPVALQGLKPGSNLFVNSSGEWLAGYTPANYQGYPFALARTQDGQQVLCFDDDSGLLSSSEGEFFFAAGDQPSKSVSAIWTSLKQHEANRIATQNICHLLHKHQLIQPWAIKLQGAEGEHTLEGLFRMDETKLNQLDAADLIELRQNGALLCAYCQLLSMQHLPMLIRLAEAQAKASSPAKKGDLDLSFLEGSETLKFF